MEFTATTPRCRLRHRWYDEQKRWLSLTYQCVRSPRVKSHSLYINIGPQQQRLLLSFPFVLLPFLSLSFFVFDWRGGDQTLPTPPPFLRNAKFRAMTYRRIWLEKKACVYMVCAYSDHLSRDCYCCYIELWNPVLRKSHMRIHLNWGQWRCCTDWKSWVSTVCGMPRLKLWRCNWNCMCVWARYAVYSVCVLTIFSVYCRCTPIIGLGERKHGQAGPKTAARTAFYCYSSFFLNLFFFVVW